MSLMFAASVHSFLGRREEVWMLRCLKMNLKFVGHVIFALRIERELFCCHCGSEFRKVEHHRM